MVTYSVALVKDSFDFLASAPDASVDHVLTDSPFNKHVQSNQISGTAVKQWVHGTLVSKGVPKVTLPFPPLEGFAFAQDLVRVAKRWAINFCAVEDFGEIRRAVTVETTSPRGKLKSHTAWVRGGIWYKPNAQGQFTGDRPAASYEGIAIMHRTGAKRWNGRGSYGLWMCNGTRGEKGRHPNQKPLDLCLKLVALFTDRGDTVLDPFAGSGRIGQACVMLGRSYVGLDNDPYWVDEATRRIETASATQVTDEYALGLCLARKATAPKAKKKTEKVLEAA